MKKVLVVTAAVLLGALAAPHANASNAIQAFEKLKALVGDWETRDEQGRRAVLHFDLTGKGAELHERYTEYEGDKITHDMVTMYYLDGDQIKLTHYCEAGNQPTMVGEYSPEKGLLTFRFLSATNLSSPDAGHMYHVVFRFIDDNHIETTWTFRKNQKDAFVEATSYTRKR